MSSKKNKNGTNKDHLVPTNEPIAVVGMACRLPGKASSPQRYWELLDKGENAVIPFPEGRYDFDEFFDETPGKRGRMYNKEGGYLQEDIKGFDPGFFGISPREAKTLDPQQRLALEMTWEAVENAGMNPDELVGSSSGVFLGAMIMDFGLNAAFNGDVSTIDHYCVSGNAASVFAGRVAYTFGWEGPTMMLDTACSSSLVATHYAMRSLRNKECNMALAGGVILDLRPEPNVAFGQLSMLSTDSRCKTFDAGANGYARGEGAAVVLLKRLSDAIADGDTIMAMLHGSHVNHDGRAGGLTVPSRTAQENLIRRAIDDAGITPDDIDYIEAHGTGTALGDPIEVHALKNVFGPTRTEEKPLVIGSVKTNIGHTEPTSGMAGLIKTILSLQNEKIPQHLNFTEWNPHIQRDGFPVEIPLEAKEWKRGDKPRYAGVSSFGFSGTNSHVVVGEAPTEQQKKEFMERPLQVLTLSAKSAEALDDTIAAYQGKMDEFRTATGEEVDAFRVARTTNIGRSHMTHRIAVVGSSAEELEEKLAAGKGAGVFKGSRSKAERRVGFLFTGQGSQFSGMGKELYETEPVFRATMDRLDTLFQEFRGESLMDIMFADDDERIHLTGYTQPALFALQASLVDLWASYGIAPTAVLGHSVGEFAAAYASGVIGLEDAFKLITERARLMQALPEGGGMAVIYATEERVREGIAGNDRLAIATVNGEENIVISGDLADVAAAVEAFEQDGISTHRLTVSHAFHSHLMDPMLDEIQAVGDSFEYGTPKVHYISNLTGEAVREGDLSGEYWRNHARGAVLFSQGMKTAAEVSKCDVFVEIGPQPTLCATGRSIVENENVSWIPSLRRGKTAAVAMTEAVANLYAVGGDIDWAGFHHGNVSGRALLPNYPYQREEYWVPMPKVKGGKSHGEHPLLGARLSTAGREVIFECSVGPETPTYLQDHCVFGACVFPGAGYFEIAMKAASTLSEGKALKVSEFGVEAPLVLSSEQDTNLQVIVSVPESDGARTLEIYSEQNGDWVRHGSCRLLPSDVEPAETFDLDEMQEKFHDSVDVDEVYQQLRDHGLEYGPQFQGILEASGSEEGVLARLAIPEDAGAYHLHPAMLDSALQSLGGLGDLADDELALPVGLDSIEVLGPVGDEVWAHGWEVEGGNEGLFYGHIDLLDGEGNVFARVRGMKARKVNRRVVMRALGVQEENHLFEIGWRRAETPTFAPTEEGHYLIISDEGGLGEKLEDKLREANQRVTRVTADGNLERALADESLTGVIHMVAADAPLGEHTGDNFEALQTRIAESCLTTVQELVRAEDPCNLWFVTRGGMPVDGTVAEVSPLQSMAWGFGRVVATEHGNVGPNMVDLDPDASIEDTVDALFAELGNTTNEQQVGYRTGSRWAARLRAADVTRLDKDTPRELAITNLGQLETLHWAPIEKQSAGEGEVKVRIRAMGMNFRDVLKALDFYPEEDRALGDESAGEVVEVGPGVERFKVGDRVLLSTPGQCFRQEIVMSENDVIVPLPDNLSYTQAVTIPIAFVTAFYSFAKFGKILPGERVLIHAGAGGVGLAAIQMARKGGAEVFATAGSERKRKYLREVLGVEHVFDSRALTFADEIMEITNGEGIDVVLNSLIGESLQKSLSILRDGGRFLEIGKTELWDSEEIAKQYPGVTYVAIALDKLLEPGPESRDGLTQLVQAFERGDFQPLPWRAFPAERVIDAFRYMQGARHIGKVVVTDYDDHTPVREDGSYLITGGLGGLGLEVAKHFARQGAGGVVLMGRSAPKPAAKKAIAEIEEMGTKVLVVAGDVSITDDVNRIFDEVDASDMPRLRGLVHSAGVLDDRPISEQTHESFAKVLNPKTIGAWNLHAATRSRPLDFFVLFSSISSVIGNYSQSNYSAANAFLDTLAHHRTSLGMPATTINWGAWSGAGMAADEELKKKLKGLGMDYIDPELGLELLDKAVLRGSSQITAATVKWERFLQFMGNDAPFYAEVSKGDSNGPSFQLVTKEELLAKLKEVPEANRSQFLFEFLEELVVKALELPEDTRIDPDAPLQDLGFDSMMAVEMGNALSAAVGFKLSATVGFDHPTPRALSDFVASKLLPEVDGYEPPAETEEQPNDIAEQLAAQQRVEQEVDAMSDEELEASLEDELDDVVGI